VKTGQNKKKIIEMKIPLYSEFQKEINIEERKNVVRGGKNCRADFD